MSRTIAHRTGSTLYACTAKTRFWRACRCAAAFTAALTSPAMAQLAELEPAAAPTAPRAVALEIASGPATAELVLDLTARTAMRVFTLDAPRRVVLDLEGVDWSGLSSPTLPPGPVADLRFGLFRDGWSRLVLDIDRPMSIDAVRYTQPMVDRPDIGARLQLRLVSASPAAFALQAGPPPSLAALPSQEAPKSAMREGMPPLVVIDPGHGGVDPGALRDGLVEKQIALHAARILAEALEATGRFRTLMTRNDDSFLGLDERVRIAQRHGAALFLSVHANTEPSGQAWGVSVFTLSQEASDAAAERLATRENRADLSAGLVDATTASTITRILADLSRQETNARSRRLADTIVSVLDRENRTLRTKPHRAAGFRVLKAPDIPSLLVELGFLTNREDRVRLSSEAWLRQLAGEIAAAIVRWHIAETHRTALFVD
ncbi:MAG: N-acetylmuramoyl-L-alanine amidase [Pseudomonadota bacterium]